MNIGRIRQNVPLHLMLLLPAAFAFVFYYLPMVGIVIAFEDFNIGKGMFRSKWIGFENFTFLFTTPSFLRVVRNTVWIALMKMVTGMVVPLVFSLLLNEISGVAFKRAVQTIVYLPHFLSWVILSGVIIDILSPSTGAINRLLAGVGIEPIFFLGNNAWFPYVLVATNVWKDFGYGTIIYLAAISTIDPTLYEAAIVDGAGKWRQVWHVTMPSIATVIVLIATLSLQSILNAGFDQVFNLYSPKVYETGDIIDTFLYRMGLVSFQWGPATAVGLFRSAVSLVFITLSYRLASRFANYRIF